MLSINRKELPDFFCPIGPVIHPGVDMLHNQTNAWLVEVGISNTPEREKRFRGNNTAEFFGRIVPEGRIDGVRIGVDWNSFGFAFDDVVVDWDPQSRRSDYFTDFIARIACTIDNPSTQLFNDNPFGNAARDLGERFRGIAGPTQMSRWLYANWRWLVGSAWMLGSSGHSGLERPNDYLMARILDCGLEPCMTLVGACLDEEIPDREMWAPPVQALGEMSWTVTVLDNERISSFKESYSGQRVHTLTDVVSRYYGYSREEAQDSVIDLRDRILTRFLALSDREIRRPETSRALKKYIGCLGNMIRGNLDWALKCPRYTHMYPAGAEDPVGIIEFATRIVTSPKYCKQPIDIPATRWWWEI